MVVATICAIIRISGIAQGEYSTVVGTLVFRFAVISIIRLQVKLSLFQPWARLCTPLLVLHHSMFAPTSSNSSKILWSASKPSTPSAAVLSRPLRDFLWETSLTSRILYKVAQLMRLKFSSLQKSRYWLTMVHLATVRTMFGITNSSPLSSLNFGLYGPYSGSSTGEM